MPNEAIELNPTPEERPPIDPAKVIVDRPPIDPAKVIVDPDPAWMNKEKRDIMKRVFSGDITAFEKDEGRKRLLETAIGGSVDREQTQKSIALSAYYSNLDYHNMGFVYDNLEKTIEKFEGKPMTVDAAYDSIAAMLNPPQPGSGGTKEVITAGAAAVEKTAAAGFNLILEGIALSHSYQTYGNTGRGKAEREAISRSSEKIAEKTVKPLKEIYERNAELALDPDWINHWNGGRWFVNAGKFLAIQAPQQSLQIAMAYLMGPAAFMSTLGAATGAEKYYDLKWDAPEMSERDRMANATLTGFINSGSAWVTAGVVKGKIPVLNKVQLKNKLVENILYFCEATGIEAGQEAVEQLAENGVDLHTGVYGDPDKMTPEEIKKHLWSGVKESALAGGVFGIGGAAVGFKSFKEQHAAMHEIVNGLEAEQKRLLDSENLADDDLSRLETVNTALETRDPKLLLNAAQGLAVYETARQQEAQITDDQLTDEQKTQMAADRAEIDNALRKKLAHDPFETIAAAKELLSAFPAFKLDAVVTAAELAPEIKHQIDVSGANLKRVRAWVDDSEVIHLIAENVRPSEVARTIGHEVIGHKGLRAVFGDKFNDLLDLVYRDHAEEVQELSQLYHRDTETVDNQRYLTEEFLAECANAKTRPSWWREFLNMVKNGLRRLPGLAKLRFSDRDIEYMLMRSARAMRRKNAANMPVGDMRLSIIGEKGAAALDRVEDVNTRLDNLAVAREMLNAGRDMKNIKFSTGWERGGDGKWRTELPDIKIKSYGVLPDGTSYQRNDDEILSNYGTLGDLVNAPEIFNAYPELEKIQLETRNAYSELSNGSYDKTANTIEIIASNKSILHKLLVHEIQHAIQNIEGFAPGGNPGNIDPKHLRNKLTPAEESRIKELENEYSKLSRQAADNAKRERTEYGKGWAASDESRAVYEKMEALERESLTLRQKRRNLSPMEGYLRLAGEVEARNASNRREMPIDERLKSLLSATEDVAEEDKIYLKEAVGGISAMAEQRPYYMIDFKDGLGRAIDPKQKNDRSPVFVGATPEVFQRIGFTALPMMMNVRHLRLNYYTKAEFEKIYGKIRSDEHAHGLHSVMGKLPAALEHPLAIVVNKTKNAKSGSVVAITDINVNGKKVVVPILIEATSSGDGQYIDSHLVLTVFDSDDWMNTFLKPAIEAEKKGVGVFYLDKEKAVRYNAYSQSAGITSTDFIHNINDDGSPVKALFKKQTETLQFRRWFGDSKVVDENGKPLVVYHGGVNDVNIFDPSLGGKSNAIAKIGTWFSDDKNIAEAFSRTWYNNTDANNGTVYSVFLSIQKPKIYESKKQDTKKIDLLNERIYEIEGQLRKLHNFYYDRVYDYKALDIFNKSFKGLIDAEYRAYFYEQNPQAVQDGEKYRELKLEQNRLRNKRNLEFYSDAYEQFKSDIYILDGQDIERANIDHIGFGLNNSAVIDEFKLRLMKDGYDGIIIKNTVYDTAESDKETATQYVVFDSSQIKSATDNIGTYDGGNPDIRYSLAEYSEAEQRDIVAILRPFVGRYMGNTDEELVSYLKQHGVDDVSGADARYFALTAAKENLALAKQRGREKRDRWILENVPMLADVIGETGDADFRIRPSFRFAGEEFSGSYISPEFVRYSAHKGEKLKGNAKQRFDARREEKLKSASGIPSDELARGIAAKQNRDALEVEQEIIDFFRDLKKADLYKQYSDWKKSAALDDKALERKMWEEFEKQEQFRIEDEVIDLLTRGQPINEEWIAANRKVYVALYSRLFNGKKAPFKPGKKDLEAINAALVQQKDDVAAFARAYKAAREKAYGEYMDKLRKFREKVMVDKLDALQMQREAVDFAEKNLPAEHRADFVSNILKLIDYPATPSAQYPDGRRQFEFKQLLKNMLEKGGKLRAASSIEAIKEMIAAVRIKRNYKGIPTSVLPSEQFRIDRIDRIVKMNVPAVAAAIDANQIQLGKLGEAEIADGETRVKIAELKEDNLLLNMFGNLELKTAEEAEDAAAVLKKIIDGGKLDFKDKLDSRLAEIKGMRSRAIDDATFGKNTFKERGDAQKHSEFILKNESLGTLMRIVSGKSIQDFDNSVGGELYRKVEDSTEEESTMLRHMQNDFDREVCDILGIAGKNPLEKKLRRGAFFAATCKKAEHSGVFKTEYSRPIEVGKNDFIFEFGRRAMQKRMIPVEDYSYYGVIKPGARSLLAKIDNGEIVTHWGDLPLDDMSIAFLRQQLADYDAGVEAAYELFSSEEDDASMNRMLKEARSTDKLMLFSHDPRETSSRIEVPLSQGEALQILLTWEQAHYQPNLKWNGWTEESIQQLKKFLKPEVARLGYWMRDYIAKNKAALDKLVFERYGAHLPETDNYFPGSFKGGNTQKVKEESPFGRGAGAMSVNPNFLIARKFHLKPVDTDADAFGVFFSNQITQSHFLAWSDTLRDLRSVYGSGIVQKAINDNFGTAVTRNLVERISAIARAGGELSDNYAVKYLSQMYRYWVPSKIALNQSSMIKQTFGTMAYMHHVPMVQFVRNLALANPANKQFREFVKYAVKSDYFQNRMSGGLDRDLQYLMNYTRDSKSYSPLNDILVSWGTIGTRWTDGLSVLTGGYAAWKYNYDQAKAAGMADSEARDAAFRAWRRLSDETQQSGALKDQNYFQVNQGAFRYFTAFMSNTIQTMNLEFRAVNELRYGSNKPAAARKLARIIAVNHLIIPTLMKFATDMIRAGFDFDKLLEESEFSDYLIGWLMGSYSGLFFVGQLMTSGGEVALDYLFGNPVRPQALASAVPLGDDVIRGIGTVAKIAKKDAFTEKELFDGMKAVGDSMMLGGAADARVGGIGAVLSAIGTQGKRVAKWFDSDR